MSCLKQWSWLWSLPRSADKITTRDVTQLMLLQIPGIIEDQ